MSSIRKKNSSKPSAQTKAEVYIMGDDSTDRFIYLEGFHNKPANLRETWVDAEKFWMVDLDGGSGNLIQYCNEAGIKAVDPCTHVENKAQSVYILTRDQNKQEEKDKVKQWRVGQAIVAGQRTYPSGTLSKSSPSFNDNTPAVILDFEQGWLNQNLKFINNFLHNRQYVVRCHDPLGDKWVDIRRKNLKPGIWFSPIQDMAKGSLWFPGNWTLIRNRIIDYLQSDETLWIQDNWKHYVIIQVAYDGAIVVGPGIDSNGELFIYKGDQPDSFAREGYGPVIAGGIVFVYSLIKAITSPKGISIPGLRRCVKAGLYRLRKVVQEGYVGPPIDDVPGQTKNWQPPSTTNLPVRLLKKVSDDQISQYSKAPFPNTENAKSIIGGNEIGLRENTVLKLGDLITSCPEYANTLLRLASMVKNHAKSGKGVMSFSIFGSPGSGKSFVAEQVALSTGNSSDNAFESITFNLSQFTDQSRLIDAFKQIQTISLQGKIPFVLWDEFDTSLNGVKAGWISSFLMPMQDARFFDGITNRALGKCIFVFIGGTFKDDSEFNDWAVNKGKEIKGPDFHSRLSSSLTVPSVDYSEMDLNETRKDPNDSDNENDWNARLVRSIMIRAFLRKKESVKHISSDVIDFLLHVPLQHGVRSLEKIISASELSKTKEFHIYHLPTIDVLQLHVDEEKLAPHKFIKRFIDKIKLENYGEPLLETEWRN